MKVRCRLIPLSIFALSTFSLADEAPPVSGYPSRLTLPYVLQMAEEHASIFDSLKASESSISAPKLISDAPYSPNLSLGVRRFDQRLEPANPFSPTRTTGTQSFLGYEQGLSSIGTRFSLELQHGNTSLNFPTIPFSPYYETRASLTARQSLIHSLWKGADRASVRAGEESQVANTIAYQQERDRATLTMIELFYRAWLAQTEVRSAQANLRNQQDLLEITRLRLRRGTAERPDLLQVQSAVHRAEIQRDRAIRTLGDVWRYLVVTLELPEQLLAYDPMKIPADLDQPIAAAENKCKAYLQSGGKLGSTLTQAFAQAQARAAAARAQALQATTGTDLTLTGNYSTNGIDGNSRAETWRNTGSRDFPAWTLELAARIPLGTSAKEGEAALAAADRIRAEAGAEQELRGANIERINRCFELAEKVSARLLAQKVVDAQLERLRLEKDRFRIGRSSLTQVVIATDDGVIAERSLRGSEVDERLAAWRVNQLEGSLQEIALGRPLKKWDLSGEEN